MSLASDNCSINRLVYLICQTCTFWFFEFHILWLFNVLLWVYLVHSLEFEKMSRMSLLHRKDHRAFYDNYYFFIDSLLEFHFTGYIVVYLSRDAVLTLRHYLEATLRYRYSFLMPCLTLILNALVFAPVCSWIKLFTWFKMTSVE